MDLTGRRVLVTGGAGFVGSHLVERLVGMTCQVFVLDDISNGHQHHLDRARKLGTVEVFAASVADEQAVEQAVLDTKCEAVFHLSALNLLRSVANPQEDLRVNALGTLNLLQAMRRSPQRPPMIFASTGSVYGEPQYSPQDEAHPLEPSSPYGISKLAAEKYVLLWHQLFDVPTVALRYYNIYGPRQNFGPTGGVVGIFLSRVLQGEPPVIEGDGLQERCFTYVDDVVSATVQAAAMEDAWGQAYNIAATEVTTVLTLAETTLKICNSTLRPVFTDPRIGDIREFRPSVAKAQEHLRYAPSVTLADGLSATKRWIETVIRPG